MANGFKMTPQMRKNIIVVSSAAAGIALLGVAPQFFANKLFNMFTVGQVVGVGAVVSAVWLWQKK